MGDDAVDTRAHRADDPEHLLQEVVATSVGGAGPLVESVSVCGDVGEAFSSVGCETIAGTRCVETAAEDAFTLGVGATREEEEEAEEEAWRWLLG